MAHRGPASKSVKHGRTTSADWTDVPDVPYAGASPDLPKLGGNKKWSDLVLLWWEQVRTMPHCVIWGPTDWQFGIETALMKEAFWRAYTAGEMKGTIATEIRRREAQLGTTGEARRQLRIRYVPAEEFEDYSGEDDTPVQVVEVAQTSGNGVATVTPIGERRARLTARSA